MAELAPIDNLITSLQKCRRNKDLAHAKRLHAHIRNNGLESHRAVGNYIVPMFVECGSMSDAQQVFDRLVHRNEHSWTSLILGYVECGQAKHALNLYQKMQHDSVHPSSYTLMALLKACARLKDLERGREIHIEIAKNGFERDSIVGNNLVNMYAKCGSLAEAQEAFDKLLIRDVVSWTALIAGFAEHAPGQKVMNCFEQMQLEGIPPDAITFVCVLKACGSMGGIHKGRKIHSEIAQKGFDKDVFVGSTLVDMYTKCCSLAEAREVFDNLPVRHVVSWNAIIAGYAEYGSGLQALECFEQMHLEGISPVAVTFVCVLKACGTLGAINKGREMHTDIVQKGFERDVFVGNILIDMYAKCGSLAEAQFVFDKLLLQDVVSWNALIAGYAEHGPGQAVLKHFEQMQLEGCSPNVVTLLCTLKACGNMGVLDKGRKIHTDIVLKGFEGDVFVGNTLVDMYVKCSSMREAQDVFDKLPVQDVVSWTALIAGYAEHGPGQQALICFEQMQLEPSTVTFGYVLKACSSIRAIDKGRKLHAMIAPKMSETDVFVGYTLVDMYAKCGSLAEAREVFDKLQSRDVVSWTALIAGYAEHGPGEEALKCCDQMQLEGISPDAITFVCILKACGSIGTIDKGREMHRYIVIQGLETDTFIGSTLVDMYVKCGSLAEAREIFDKLPVRDVVSWNALIAGYAEHGPGQEALKCFEQMQLESTISDASTFVCVLKACCNIGAIGLGRAIHSVIARKGFERDFSIGSILVDMYAKCGSISEAQEVFDKLPVRDVVSWNALIKGYGMNLEGDMAVQCFEDMEEQGVKPDDVTFTCLLSACSRARLVLKGQELFNLMQEKYGIAPTTDHFTLMVVLLAQSGHLDEAENFLESIPCSLSWTPLLSACKMYGEVELGLRCFQQLVQMNPESAAPYVLMAKIYASSCRRDDAYRIEELRKHAGAKKKAASASIEVNKMVHEFVVGDSQTKEMSTMLEMLSSRMKVEGHVPNVNMVLGSSSDEEGASCEHGEKLAVSFGLINTAQGQMLI